MAPYRKSSSSQHLNRPCRRTPCGGSWLLLTATLATLTTAHPEEPGNQETPTWARSAIWYQIFVERFRNGDPSNDPTPESMRGAAPGSVPPGWKVTPWQQDWYENDAWAKSGEQRFHHLVAARRFGGDLQGVLDKLDYLQELGVSAIYFNPLNDSPSLHKYDARHYRHIDRHFGPDPLGDARIIESEDPRDPQTWRWTSADRLFLELIEAIHARGMRLIVDYSWNHTGITFWAWENVKAEQGASPFRDWYDIIAFDDPATPENEFSYHGWIGVKTLPELKKVDVQGKRDGYAFEGNLQPNVKQHIYHVTRRWLDPNQDGDPSDGIDGFRLDVAHHVPLGFWRDYRRFVREINPEALLLGEAWWTKWPDELMDPRPFLRGDVFDSVMHYQWYRPARRFFAQANGGLKPSGFIAEMKRVYHGYGAGTREALMNLTSSHDSPRLATSFQNKQHPYKFKMGARGNPTLDLRPPNARTLREMRLLLLHQFTFLSAPHIWNGEELGMWGADDPDCRKPLLWKDIDHDPQVYQPDGTTHEPIPVRANADLLAYYQEVIALRRNRTELVEGDLRYTTVDDEQMTLVYRRASHGDGIAWVAFNRSELPQTIRLEFHTTEAPKLLLESVPDCVNGLTREEDRLVFKLSPLTGAAFGSKD